MKRRRKAPMAKCEVIEVPRRWWQSKSVRLRCSCGWLSPDTWPARPTVEIAYTIRVTMLAIAELHWGSRDHENRRYDPEGPENHEYDDSDYLPPGLQPRADVEEPGTS